MMVTVVRDALNFIHCGIQSFAGLAIVRLVYLELNVEINLESKTSPNGNEEKSDDNENEYLCVWCACKKKHKNHNRACLDTEKNMVFCFII